MPIIEHFDTADEAKDRAGDLIGSAKGPNPVYGLQVTGVVVIGPQPSNTLHDWTLEVETKLVKILAAPGVPKTELDCAYEKLLEENAVLRRSNTAIYQQVRTIRATLDSVKTEPIYL